MAQSNFRVGDLVRVVKGPNTGKVGNIISTHVIGYDNFVSSKDSKNFMEFFVADNSELELVAAEGGK